MDRNTMTDRPTVVHVRLNGLSRELPLSTLDLAPGAPDERVKEAVARSLDCPLADLNRHVVVRTSAAIIVRPEAGYG